MNLPLPLPLPRRVFLITLGTSAGGRSAWARKA